MIPKLVHISRPLTANEAIKRIIVHKLQASYNLHFYSAAIQRDASVDMWFFIAEAAHITVKGYVGCLGQIVVTWEDGKRLDYDKEV